MEFVDNNHLLADVQDIVQDDRNIEPAAMVVAADTAAVEKVAGVGNCPIVGESATVAEVAADSMAVRTV